MKEWKEHHNGEGSGCSDRLEDRRKEKEEELKGGTEFGLELHCAEALVVEKRVRECGG